MDLEGIMLSEKSQTEKEKQRMFSLMCGIQKNKQTNKQSRNKLIDTEQELTVAKWEAGRQNEL